MTHEGELYDMHKRDSHCTLILYREVTNNHHLPTPYVQATGLRLGIILQIVVGFAVAVVISLTSSWELTFVLIFCFPVLGAFSFLQVHHLAGRTANNKEKLEESGDAAVQSFDNIHTVVSLGVEDYLAEKYNDLLQYPLRLVMSSTLPNYLVPYHSPSNI